MYASFFYVHMFDHRLVWWAAQVGLHSGHPWTFEGENSGCMSVVELSQAMFSGCAVGPPRPSYDQSFYIFGMPI